MKLRLYQNHFAITKLAAIPPTLHQDLAGSFYSLTVTDDEVSLICESTKLGYNTIKCDKDWRLFRIEGVLDLSMIGVIAAMAKVLAQHEISIFVMSSYNTDYALIRAKQTNKACSKLREAGYIIAED